MPVHSFDQWFANYLEQDASEVARLLTDKTAIRFLIAWSLFETSCFDREAKVENFEAFARNLVSTKGFHSGELRDAAIHFHERYQDKELYRNLMHQKEQPRLVSILSKDFESLSADEIVFFVIFVVFRFRNNIFHGNKGVASWLKFRDQIELCIKVMQTFITFVEALCKAAEQGDADAQERHRPRGQIPS
jgi:hypothetical protein